MRSPAPAKANFLLFLPVIVVHTILLGASIAGVEKHEIPELDHIRSMVADEDARIRLEGLTWLAKWVFLHPEQHSKILNDKKIMSVIRESMLNPSPLPKDNDEWDDDSEEARALETSMFAWESFFMLRRKEAGKLARRMKSSEVGRESLPFARMLDGLREMYRTTISIDLEELSVEQTMSVLRLLAKSPHAKVRKASILSLKNSIDQLFPGEASQIVELLAELYEEEDVFTVRYSMCMVVVDMGESVSGSKEFLMMVVNSERETKRLRQIAGQVLDYWNEVPGDE